MLVPLDAQATFYAGASARAAADIMSDVAKAKASQLDTYAKYKDLASVRGLVQCCEYFTDLLRSTHRPPLYFSAQGQRGFTDRHDVE